MRKTSPDYSKDGNADRCLNQIRKDYNKAVEQLEIMRATGKTPLPVKFKVVGIESAITRLNGVIPRGELDETEYPQMNREELIEQLVNTNIDKYNELCKRRDNALAAQTSLNTASKLINWSEIARRLNMSPAGFLNRLNGHGAARALTNDELAAIRELIEQDLFTL